MATTKNARRDDTLTLHAAARRTDALDALRDGRKPGRGGYHKNQKAYDRSRDRKRAIRAAW